MNNSPLRPRHWVAIGLGMAGLIALSILFRQGDVSPRLLGPAEPDIIITSGTVKTGDVFALLLQKSGVPAMQVPQIQRALSKLYDMRKIQPGHMYEIITSTDGVFQKFVYRLDPVHSYAVVRSSDSFKAAEETIDTVWVEKRVKVKVTRFLEADLRSAGYDPILIDNLSWELGERIFGWRIDFFTEQRVGDELDVLLEQEFALGEDKPIPGGKHMRVIAASYIGSGTKFKENFAIRYQPPNEKSVQYYDEKGGAVKRVFLRAPFTKGAFRVSSGFNRKRFHPILRTYRAHHGTDYAAAHGTPVAAIGAGTVVRAEWYKGYGKCVDIRHNAKYVSRYGHLSRIAVRSGQKIGQGQYLGNVGSTGLSTGPHLHFEMLVNGTQQNFLAMSFPAASSVSPKDMADFNRVRDEALARLNASKASASINVAKK